MSCHDIGRGMMTTRKRIHVDYELPIGDEYGKLIRSIIEKEGKKR